MSHWKAFGLAIFAVVCLLGEGATSVYAQCDFCATEWSGGSVINLGGLPGFAPSVAEGINDAGQVVGESGDVATEWSGGSIINLGGLPGFTTSQALSINDAGHAVGLE